MNVRELRAQLEAFYPEALVTVEDPYLHRECHARIDTSPWAVRIESTGSVVTEEDVQ